MFRQLKTPTLLLASLLMAVALLGCDGRSGSSGVPFEGSSLGDGPTTTVRTKVALSYTLARGSMGKVVQMVAKEADYRSASVKLTLPDGRILVMSYDGAGEYSCKVENLPAGSAGFISAAFGGVVVKNFFDGLTSQGGAMDAGLTNPDSTLAADALNAFAQALAPVEGGYSVAELLSAVQNATLDIDVAALRTQVEDGQVAGYEIARQSYNSILVWDNIDLASGVVANLIETDEAVKTLNEQIANGGMHPPLRTYLAEEAKLVVAGFLDEYMNTRTLVAISPYLADINFLSSGDDKPQYLLSALDEWSTSPKYLNLQSADLAGLSYAVTEAADFTGAASAMYLVTVSGTYDLTYVGQQTLTRVWDGTSSGFFVGKVGGEWMIFGDRMRMWFDYSVGYFNTSNSGTFTELSFALGNSGTFTPLSVAASNTDIFGASNPVDVTMDPLSPTPRYRFTIEGAQDTTWSFYDIDSYVPTEVPYVGIDSKVLTITATYSGASPVEENYRKVIRIKEPTTVITGFTQSPQGDITVSWRPPLIDQQLLRVEVRLVGHGLSYTLPASDHSIIIPAADLSSAGLSAGTNASLDVVYFTPTAEFAERQQFTYQGSTVIPRTEPPTFAPAPGVYLAPQAVAITSATSGASIYYTTDGTSPTFSGNPYSGPVMVSQSMTLKAIAVAAGLKNSTITTGVYQLNIPPVLTLITSTLSDGLLGLNYSRPVIAAGGDAPYTWSLDSGTLPTGLSLDPGTGVISGIPSAAGTFTFTLRVFEQNTNSVAKAYTVNITDSPVISTSALATGLVGTFYNQAIDASGGVTPYSWTVVTGSLPAGLTLSGDTISGTPSAAGTSNFTVRCTGANTLYDEQALSITISLAPVAPTITTTSLPSGLTLAAYSQVLSATGGTTPYSWTVVTGSLPTGLTLSGDTISGTPSAAGTSNFTVRCTGDNTLYDEQALSIVVSGPPTITTLTLPGGVLGSAYSQQLAASGGISPYSWTVVTGSLPAGLTLSGDTISGTPSAAETSNFTVRCTGDNTLYDEQALSIAIAGASEPPTITIGTLPDGTQGSSYTQAVTITGGTGPYIWSMETGTLPPGLTLNTSTGEITGTPPTPGTYTFTLRCTDSASGLYATRSITLAINTPQLTEMIDLSTAGVQAANGAWNSVISGNGRYVAFESSSTNLVANDTNGMVDCFVRDRLTGVTERVSVNSSGSEWLEPCASPVISADGRFVAFKSNSPTWIHHVWVRDRQKGTTTQASVWASGAYALGNADNPAISDDGRYVTFQSQASNLVAGDTNGNYDIFRRDMLTGTTILVSLSSTGALLNGNSDQSRISADGNKIIFGSNARNVVPGNSAGNWNLYVRDVNAGTTVQVDLTNAGQQPNVSNGFNFNFSGDGNFVVFDSEATNMVAGDTNGLRDIFLRNVAAGTTTLISVTAAGEQGNGHSSKPKISLDGRYVSFISAATNLAAGDANGYDDVFVRDNNTGIVTLASISSTGAQSDQHSSLATISDDGQQVAFDSTASNLVASDTYAYDDVFVHGLPLGVNAVVPVAFSLPLRVYYSAQTLSLSTATPGAQIYYTLDDTVPTTSSTLYDGTPISIPSTTTIRAIAVKSGLSDSPETKGVFLISLPFMVTTPSPPPNGLLGAPYSLTLAATGGIAPYTWSLASGTLPPGISLSSAGVLSGTPTTAGTFSFAARVTDSLTATTTRSFNFTIISPPTITTGSLPGGAVGLAYSQTLAFSDPVSQSHTWSISAGTLPTGLSIVASTGTISGTPSAAGSFTFTVSCLGVTNGLAGTQAYTVTIAAAPTPATAPSITSPNGDTYFAGSMQITLTFGSGQTLHYRLNGGPWLTATTSPLVENISSTTLFESYTSEAGKLDSSTTSRTYTLGTFNLVSGTNLVSKNLAGALGDSHSYAPSFTSDMKYVAFHSGATNLVSGVTNTDQKVFVKNLTTGEVKLVSVAANGTQGSGYYPKISDNGRYVVFESTSSTLLPDGEDTNGTSDIYRKDLQTGEIVRVSVVNGTNAQAVGHSRKPDISADGRYVVFESGAQLVSNDTDTYNDAYIRDMQTNTTWLLGVPPSGVKLNQAVSPAISSDGRFAVFTSMANNLVANDTNSNADTFVREIATGVISRVSVKTGGGQSNGNTQCPSISADGRFVAFVTQTMDLDVRASYALSNQIYLHDRQTTTTTLVSIGYNGQVSDGGSLYPKISADGRYVAFLSGAFNLVPGITLGSPHMYLRDMLLGITTLISVNDAHASVGLSVPSDDLDISGDGRYSAFSSGVALTTGDALAKWDIFIHDEGPLFATVPTFSTPGGATTFSSPLTVTLNSPGGGSIYYSLTGAAPYMLYTAPITLNETATITAYAIGPNSRAGNPASQTYTSTIPLFTERADLTLAGAQAASGATGRAPLSADGRFVAFVSASTDLVPGDTNVKSDCFVRDRLTGVTEVVSVSSSGVFGNDHCAAPMISADGRYVTFHSAATNLVANDSNATVQDVFMHDRQTGATTLISVSSSGVAGNSASSNPSISADGRYVSFTSSSTTFDAGDTNAVTDIFRHDNVTGATIRVSLSYNGAMLNGASEDSSISADGDRIVFSTLANNAVAATDNNLTKDVFLREVSAAKTTRMSISERPGASPPSGNSLKPVISGDGKFVAFHSLDDVYGPNPANGVEDVFLCNVEQGTTSFASVNASRVLGNGISTEASLSYDGRYLAYRSQATNLVAGDTNAFSDIFVRDNLTGVVTRMSLSNAGAQTNNANTGTPWISADGRHVSFYSSSTNLVTGDTNAAADIFVRGQALGSGAVSPIALSVPPRTSSTGLTVALSTSTSGAQIYYTLDDTAPTTTSTPYGGTPLSFTSTGTYTIRTIAVKSGLLDSPETIGVYTINIPPAPTITLATLPNSPQNSTYSQTVNISGGASPFTWSIQSGSLPTGLTLNTTTGAITGTPTTQGTYNFTLRCTDANSLYGEVSYTVKITAPVFYERLSVTSAGYEAVGVFNIGPQTSDDGRFVAFSTTMPLEAGDADSYYDVYVRDRLTGQTTRVSNASNGTKGNGDSQWPSISGDGRYVVFNSSATNLVANDTNYAQDVFLHDRQTGITTRISVTNAGAEINAWSSMAAISRDGKKVVFTSGAPDTVLDSRDTNGTYDVFVSDLETGINTLVSLNSSGTVSANAYSDAGGISADGNIVTFTSSATNITSVPSATSRVYARNLTTGVTTLVSRRSNGAATTAPSSSPTISWDGTKVAFISFDNSLVLGDTQTTNYDVFVRDIAVDANITRLSVSSTGEQANNANSSPHISGDGRIVVFESDATNLVAGDVNLDRDIFLRDLVANTISRVTTNNNAAYPTLSGDGSQVFFISGSAHEAGDTNGNNDVYAFGPALGVGASAPVVFSVAPRIYAAAQSVALSTSTSGAQIYYTLDDTVPTTSSTLFDGTPISIPSTTTIRAIAVKSGLSDSPETTGLFTIVP